LTDFDGESPPVRVPGSVAGRSTTLKAMFSMAPPHLRKVALAALVVAVGLALRVFLLRSGFGDLNGDEAYAGLQSLGVLRDGRFPVVIDGNVYSAVIEAYLFSPVLVFAGGSVVVLKMLFVGIRALCGVLQQ